jgi:hypothetical protein
VARTRRLDALRSDVREQADLGGLTGRHPDANLTRHINQAIAAFRLLLSREGHPFYLKEAPDSTEAGIAEYSLPDDFIYLYGVDLEESGKKRSLEPFELIERNDYESSSGSDGVPVGYRLHSEGKIRFLPTPVDAYSYTLLYLPTQTDLSSDSDTFDGIAGWEDWIVLDAGMRCLAKDEEGEQFAILQRMRDEKTAEILSTAKRRGGGPACRVDTRGRKRAMRAGPSWRYG